MHVMASIKEEIGSITGIGVPEVAHVVVKIKKVRHRKSAHGDIIRFSKLSAKMFHAEHRVLLYIS